MYVFVTDKSPCFPLVFLLSVTGHRDVTKKKKFSTFGKGLWGVV